MAAARVQALVVVVDLLTVRFRERIVKLVIQHRLLAMYGFREFIDSGGLMAYNAIIAVTSRAPRGSRA